jgi:hypothetical protein
MCSLHKWHVNSYEWGCVHQFVHQHVLHSKLLTDFS